MGPLGNILGNIGRSAGNFLSRFSAPRPQPTMPFQRPNIIPSPQAMPTSNILSMINKSAGVNRSVQPNLPNVPVQPAPQIKQPNIVDHLSQFGINIPFLKPLQDHIIQPWVNNPHVFKSGASIGNPLLKFGANMAGDTLNTFSYANTINAAKKTTLPGATDMQKLGALGEAGASTSSWLGPMLEEAIAGNVGKVVVNEAAKWIITSGSMGAILGSLQGLADNAGAKNIKSQLEAAAKAAGISSLMFIGGGEAMHGAKFALTPIDNATKLALADFLSQKGATESAQVIKNAGSVQEATKILMDIIGGKGAKDTMSHILSRFSATMSDQTGAIGDLKGLWDAHKPEILQHTQNFSNQLQSGDTAGAKASMKAINDLQGDPVAKREILSKMASMIDGAARKKAAPPPAASTRIGDVIQGNDPLAKYRARQGEYTKRFGPEPAPSEIAKSNTAAEGHLTLGVKAEPKPADKFTGGSAQENVASMPTEASKPTVETPVEPVKSAKNAKAFEAPKPGAQVDANTGATKAPEIIRQRFDSKYDRYINKATGEVIQPKHDGSPLSELSNFLLRHREGAYSESVNGRSITKVHGDATGGFQGLFELHKQRALDFVNSHLSSTERQQVVPWIEGTLKNEQVSPAVREIGAQIKDYNALDYAIKKDARPKTGYTEDHSLHINTGPHEVPQASGSKFSTRTGGQMSRTVLKFTDAAGKTAVGTADHLKLTPQADGTFADAAGKVFHAATATLTEKTDAGLSYETDITKILDKQMSETYKTASNARLADQLKNDPHFSKDVIPRNGAAPPRGFSRSNIPGLEDRYISNKYNKYLKTINPAQKGALGQIFKILTEPIARTTTLSNTALFTGNPVAHLPNMVGQFLQVAGTGKGPIELPAVFDSLKSAPGEIAKLDPKFVSFMESGGRTAIHNNNGLSLMERVLGKNVGGTLDKIPGLNLPGKVSDAILSVGSKLNNTADTLMRYAEYKNLVAKGMSGRAAVDHIDKLMVDYGNTTLFENDTLARIVPFYRFFKGELGALKETSWGVVKNPKVNAGVALNAALIYAGYHALDSKLQSASGNKNASLKLPGSLGLIDSALKAPSQVQTKTYSNGFVKQARVPSIIGARTPVAIKETINQIVGRDIFGTGKTLPSGISARMTHAAGQLITQVQDVQNSPNRTLLEAALSKVGVYLPHGDKSMAAPALGTNSPLNKPGLYNKVTADALKQQATDFKAAGGSKLLFDQISRIRGSQDQNKFFAANPQLDPLSKSFQGYNLDQTTQVSSGVKAGFDAAANLKDKLAYMQNIQLSGNSYFQKFFAKNPTLDPTSKQFQGFNANAQKKAAVKEAKYQASKGSSRVRSSTRSAIRRIGRTSTHVGVVKIPGVKLSRSSGIKQVTPHRFATHASRIKVNAIPLPKSRVAKAPKILKVGNIKLS